MEKKRNGEMEKKRNGAREKNEPNGGRGGFI
jgi:hypothetical protein